MKINIIWFRRDLRLEDNMALNKALEAGLPVLPLFIFDNEIINELTDDDARISFIYSRLSVLNKELQKAGNSICVLKGKPEKVWKNLLASYDINSVFINKDYEPYSVRRDNAVKNLLREKRISLFNYKDQVIFEENDVLKPDNKPYTVFTAYKKKWLQKYLDTNPEDHKKLKPGSAGFYKVLFPFPSLEEIGFRPSSIAVKPYNLTVIGDYHKFRDFPAEDLTTYLSPYLRFGCLSIRNLVRTAIKINQVFLGELIWREFFMQILFHFPHVVTRNFKPVYDDIPWRNDEKEFDRWCRGETGYPIVDAGMRQLNETGYMHNRVRMITAGFLCKHLLIDWRWGEAYFAGKLIDYELSSNNGNWQWAAGTGCDAAPYFRIFNPETQQKKFDPENEYVRRWVMDYDKHGYPGKMIDHDFARKRAIDTYIRGIKISFKKS